MGLGAEAFTVLAILEARDQASAIWNRMTGTVNKFTESMGRAAETTKASGDAIDESLLKTASGADALDVASARVDTALAKEATATRDLATAEKELLDAQAQLASSADGDAAAETRAAAASDAYAAAQKRAADATKVTKDAQARQAAVSDALAASQDTAGAAAEKSGNKFGSVASTLGKVGIGMGLAGGLMVKMAGDFQSSTEHLVTDAGESQSQLDRVRAGMLQIGSATGTTASDISLGMYHIESSLPQVGNAATRATNALNILQIAAQGAKVGNASLDTVSKALVGTMNAYASKGYTATQMMNALITTVGAGDMKMEDLAGGLGNVAPLAAAAGLSFAQVGGAIAVMTSQNMSADQAMQDMANSIRSLQNPNNVAIQEMQQLGINANDVSENLGKRGMTGTLDMLTTALANHTHGGQVFIDTLKSSQIAAQGLNDSMKKLPAGLQAMAKGLLNGSVTAAQWNATTKDMPVGQKNLAAQFLLMAKHADSFNQLLKSGKPEAQSFNAALASMMGGATGLNTALMLTGPNMATYQANVDKIGQSLSGHAKDVDNWSAIQGTFNQKMSVAKVSLENTGIAIGTALLPAVTSMVDAVMKVLRPLAQWAEGHQHLAAIIFGSIAGFMLLVGAINLGVKAFNAVKGAGEAVGKVFMTLGRWLGIVKTSQEEATVATEANTVAEEEQAVATDANTVSTDANNASMLTSVIMLGRAAFGFLALKTAQIAQAVASKAAAAGMWLVNAAMTAAPILLIIAAIAALAYGIYELVTHWKQVWNDIKHWAEDAWNFIYNGFGKYLLPLLGPVGLLALGAIELSKHWKEIWGAIKQAVSDVIGWIEGHWRLIISIIGGPIGQTVALVTKYWKDIVKFFQDGVHTVEGILSWFGSLPGKFHDWFEQAKNAVIDRMNDVINWLKGAPGRIVNAFGNLGDILYNAGKAILEGLLNGLKSAWNDVSGWVSQVGGWISNLKGPIEVDAVLLTPHGHQIMQGLMKGLKAEMPALEAQLGGVSATITNSVGALPAAASGGARGGGVYIDLRGSQVMTERDMDMLINKLGRALAVRVAPQGSLRVAM